MRNQKVCHLASFFHGITSAAIVSVGVLGGLSGCGPTGLQDSFQVAAQNDILPGSDPSPVSPQASPPPTTTPPPVATPIPSEPKTEKFATEYAPLWEKARPKDGKGWTANSFMLVNTYGDALLAGTPDVTSFCANYFALTHNQKLNFWVFLVSAVTKYESAYNPRTRYHETTLGKDAVTRLDVYSEGLLQLSYQDVVAYPFCNEFDWQTDRHLAVDDPRKTIFDPLKNLTCGIRILNQQVKRKGLIAVRGYWSTLFPVGTNRNSKVTEIKSLTNKITFCAK